MGYSERDNRVRVDFFKPSGKWYCTEAVEWPEECWDGDIIIHAAFAEALNRHLEGGRLSEMDAVCLEPYHQNEHPIQLKRGSWVTYKRIGNEAPHKQEEEADHLAEPREMVEKPVQWKEGWLAWFIADELASGEIVQLKARVHDGARNEPWEIADGTYVYESDLSIPTRQQLAVTIPGTEPPVQAWAMEEDDRVVVFYRNADNRPPTMAVMRERFEAEALGLHIVPAEQVEAQYGGVFPPEE